MIFNIDILAEAEDVLPWKVRTSHNVVLGIA